MLREAIWQTRPNTNEFRVATPLSHSFITAMSVELEKVFPIDMQNLATAC